MLLEQVRGFRRFEFAEIEGELLERFDALARRDVFWKAISEEPGITEDSAAEHDAVCAGRFCLGARIRKISHVSVAQDDSLRAMRVPQRDGARHQFPVRFHLAHFLAGTQVHREGIWLGSEDNRKPGIHYFLVVPD